MKQEITNIDKNKGYIVTIKFTPNFFEKLVGSKTYERKFFAEFGHVQYDMVTKERVGLFSGFGFEKTHDLLHSVRKKEDDNRTIRKMEQLDE